MVSNDLEKQQFILFEDGLSVFKYVLIEDLNFVRKYEIIVSRDEVEKRLGDYVKNSKNIVSIEQIQKLAGKKKNKILLDFEDHIVRNIISDMSSIDNTLTNITNLKIHNFISSEFATKDISFEVIFSYTKKISLPDISAVEISVSKYIPSDKMISEYINGIKQKTFDYIEKDDSYIENNDIVFCDGVGYFFKNNIKKKFKKGTFNNMKIKIGEGKIISDLEEGIKNMKVGDAKTIPVTFPVDYHDVLLSGKEAFFDISIKKIEKAIEIKNEDDFLKKIGIKSKSDLEKEVQKMYNKQLVSVSDNKIREELYQKILSLCDLETSDYIIKAEKNKLQRIHKDKDDSELLSMARDNIKLATIFLGVSQDHNIKVSDSDCQKYIYESYGGNMQYINYFIQQTKSNPNILLELKNEILENKVFQYMKGLIKIIEKEEIIDNMDFLKEVNDIQ